MYIYMNIDKFVIFYFLDSDIEVVERSGIETPPDSPELESKNLLNEDKEIET